MKQVLWIGWVAGAVLNGASAALPSRPVATVLEVVDSMAVGRLTPVSVGQRINRVTTQFGSSVSASTVIGISGRPNQAYSIRLPQLDPSGKAVIFEHLTAWSDNAGGLIVAGRSTRMDANGRDVLRLNGDMHIVDQYTANGAIASMTLGIDYQ